MSQSDQYVIMMRQIRQAIADVKAGHTISYGTLTQLVGHAEGVNAVGWDAMGITREQARALCPEYQALQEETER